MLKLASLFKWHIEARYSALNVKPCNFSEAISKNFAIATFIKKVSEGRCPLMLDFDKVETDNLYSVGVFKTKTGGTSKEPKSVLRTTQSWIKSFEVINSLQKDKENYLIFGDLTHSLALYGMVEALYLGHNVHHVQKLRSKSELKALVKFEPTFVSVSYTHLTLPTILLV